MRIRRGIGLAVVAGSLLVGIGCAGPPAQRATGSPSATAGRAPSGTAVPPEPLIGRAAGSIRVATLTSPSGGAYRFHAGPRSVTASASPETHDVNIREVFWSRRAPFGVDGQVCATWNDPATFVDDPYPQPGLALRIAASGAAGGLRAVTVTQSVYGGGIWIVWVDGWDTATSRDPTGIASFNVYGIVGRGAHRVASPWHVCARTSGERVEVKIWTGGHAEPPWDDPDHVFAANLPSQWVYGGYAGGYVGHLKPSQKATFTDLAGWASGRTVS